MALVAVSVDGYLDGLVFYEFVSEPEVGYFGSSGRVIHGEELQACTGYVVELAIAVGHKFVALLGGGIQAHRIVHAIVDAEGTFLLPLFTILLPTYTSAKHPDNRDTRPSRERRHTSASKLPDYCRIQ